MDGRNPIIEGRIRMQELFDKIETILNENFEIISNLLVPIVKENNEPFMEGDSVASSDGKN